MFSFESCVVTDCSASNNCHFALLGHSKGFLHLTKQNDNVYTIFNDDSAAFKWELHSHWMIGLLDLLKCHEASQTI